MNSEEDGNSGPGPVARIGKKLGAVLGAVLLFVVVKGGGALVGYGISHGVVSAAEGSGGSYANSTSPQPSASELETALSNDPRFSKPFKVMKLHYPAELNDMFSRSMSSSDPKSVAFHFMKNFRIEHSAGAAQAPDAQLNALLLAELSTMEFLAPRSEQACAAMGFGTAGPDFVWPTGTESKLADSLPIFIEAAALGEKAPVGRDFSYLSDRIADRWVSGMMADGITQAQLEAFFDGSIMQSSHSDQCVVALAMYRSIAAMDAADAAFLYAFLMNEAAAAL